ncbi:tetratricopeptide repeat protein [Rhizobium laguerreae]|uniref:Type II protein arginine methyltransferase n=1 Tax=Rhizobium laguerreae TaxID=1076926 RepID=A0ABR6GJ46_9HYPH|nr:tetratricopeptide repeat protein [Rhizobium laguerreae]MBB3166315.1 type II protein arginine methyltransferase [Rhizobium laguerreae]NKM21020.1 tetratricopeptide repeat protein [Rhizobium laguerreae]NKM88680.1 tetratricopeptide repeat protein [Rhizobium laguerreae]UFW67003.1 protein arginine N-methyltransferase [Rhizobium laguerreae]
MTADSEVFALAQVRESLNQAMKFHAAGEIDRAEQYYREVLKDRYRVLDVLPLLAGIAALKGDAEAAIAYWTDMLRIKPDHLVALLEKGALLLKRGDTVEAIGCFEDAAKASPNNPLVLNNLSVALARANRHDDALDGFRRMMQLQPENILPVHQVRRLTSRIVPFWHIPMLNDVPRNEAFEAAITKAVAAHGTSAQILDIGAGSGLLSMMAARAGATNIVTCEAVPVIADTAKRIVAQNGFSARIAVINKMSTDLVIGEDMENRADILVSEILSSDLLAEEVLNTFEDAHTRLISDEATIIPRAATAVGCLVESSVLSKYSFVDEVSGFDVSEFSALAANRLPVHGTMTEWKRLSSDIELLTIDLTRPKHSEEIRILDIPIISDGVATGVVQWMKIDLAEGIEFANHPDDYSDGGWLQVLHPFPKPINVQAGTMLKIVAGHDRNSLILMPAVSAQN